MQASRRGWGQLQVMAPSLWSLTWPCRLQPQFFLCPTSPNPRNLFPRGLSLLDPSHLISFIKLCPAIGFCVNSHSRIVSNLSKILYSLAQTFLLLFPPKFSNLSHHHSFFPIPSWIPALQCHRANFPSYSRLMRSAGATGLTMAYHSLTLSSTW